MTGTRIGRYETRRLLGRGGFGLVFAARDVELDRDIALKVLLPEHTYNAQLMQRFFQEARAAAKIEHPAIVTIHEFGRIAGTDSPFDGSAYIAMEMVRGEGLAARLQRVGRIPVADAIVFVRQVASALAAAHSVGIIHRDLKPDNLMLALDPVAPLGERVKVLDFGIAKLAEATAQHDLRTGHVTFGTPRYMSPEQYRSAGTVDCRTDIYALGCILFELITGAPPFVGDFVELLELHSFGRRPLLRALVPDAPQWVEALVDAMIAADPEARPQTMAHVEHALASERLPRAASVPADGAGMSATQPSTVAAVEAAAQAPRVATTLGAAASGVAVQAPTARPKWLVITGAVAAIAALIVVMLVMRAGGRTTPDTEVAGTPPAAAITPPTPSPVHVRAEAARAQAVAYIDQKLFDYAIAEYQTAYELEPTPEVLFAIADAQRLKDDPKSAIETYKRYLATAAGGPQAELARAQIAKLTKLVIAGESTKPVVPVAAVRPAAHVTPAKQPATGSGSAAAHVPRALCPTDDPICSFGGGP